MKKFVFIAASALLLTGCAAKPSSTAEKTDKARTSQHTTAKAKHESKKQPVKTQSETVYYHQLTQADRNNVTFAFQAIQDTTKAAPGQAANAPSPFSVDMQVTNNSDKTIKLDESKIVWLMPNVDPVSADQSKVLTIEPQQTANVAEIFSNFNGQNFVDAGAFCYMNSDYKLAYSYLAHNEGGVTSKNLTDPKLIAMNDPADNNSAQTQPESDSDESSSSDVIGENYNPSIKVTPASQFSSFAFTNTTDHPITISPDSIMLVVNDGQMSTAPQGVIDAGDITINPGQTHNYVGLFGDEVDNASSLSIALDTGGNIIWSWRQ